MTDTRVDDERQERTRAENPAPEGREDNPFAGYRGGEEMPLGSFVVLMGLYGAAFAGFLAAARNKERPLPERVGLADLLLLGVATHKISRLITRDWVTSPLRAPFTEYRGSSGAGEVSDRARGTGMQRALGELFT